MEFRETFFRWVSNAVMGLLLLAGVYCAVNAYLFTSGPDANGIAVAAWSSFGSLFIVFAIFLMVSSGINRINNNLERLADKSDEELKALKFIARQNKTPQ